MGSGVRKVKWSDVQDEGSTMGSSVCKVKKRDVQGEEERCAR